VKRSFPAKSEDPSPWVTLRERFRRSREVLAVPEQPPTSGVHQAFTVMSFNVGNGLAPPGLLAKFLDESGVDIIGLQELAVPQSEAVERLLEEQYPYRVLLPTGFSGKGLLSRFPIRGSASVSLAPERPDLHATLDVHGQGLTVFVAHPRPPRITRTGAVFDADTAGQIEMVAEMAVAREPALVLGDFNMTERQPEHGFLRSAGLIDAFQESGARGASFPRRIGHTHRFGDSASRMRLRPVIRIDYVWYTPQLIAHRVWVGGDAGSDHLPVLARLGWRDRKTEEREAMERSRI
jgi:vancomycin resistance protein VanJ